MAYSDRLAAFKAALDGYSENEEKLSELYKTARQKNEQEKNNELKRLESDYKSERNAVFADNARDERNTFGMLASRGLSFSGEAAQAKLNSNITLSNRLGELASTNSKSRDEINKEYADNAHALELEEAEKRSSFLNEKNALLADIAHAELDYEQKERELALEKELQYAKLEAEKEMQEKELAAKYQSTLNGNTSKPANSNNNTASSDETKNETASDGVVFSPEIKPKDLAKLTVVNATGGDYINSENDAYLVNRYLLEMQENYNLSDEYMEELIFMLKAYGLKELTPSELRQTVITEDARQLYDYNYNKLYKEYIDRGVKAHRARYYAAAMARTETLNLLYERTENRQEFFEYCKVLEIDDTHAKGFAADKVWYNKSKDVVEKSENKQVNKKENTVSTLN